MPVKMNATSKHKKQLAVPIDNGVFMIKNSYEEPRFIYRNTKLYAYINLKKGFEYDHVIILFNGLEIFNKKGVRTGPENGSAGSFITQIDRGKLELGIFITSRKILKKIKIQVVNDINIQLSIVRKKLEHKISGT